MSQDTQPPKPPRPLSEIVKGMICHRDDLQYNAKWRRAKAYEMTPSPDRWKIEIEAANLQSQADQLQIFIPQLEILVKAESSDNE